MISVRYYRSEVARQSHELATPDEERPRTVYYTRFAQKRFVFHWTRQCELSVTATQQPT